LSPIEGFKTTSKNEIFQFVIEYNNHNREKVEVVFSQKGGFCSMKQM